MLRGIEVTPTTVRQASVVVVARVVAQLLLRRPVERLESSGRVRGSRHERCTGEEAGNPALQTGNMQGARVSRSGQEAAADRWSMERSNPHNATAEECATPPKAKGSRLGPKRRQCPGLEHEPYLTASDGGCDMAVLRASMALRGETVLGRACDDDAPLPALVALATDSSRVLCRPSAKDMLC